MAASAFATLWRPRTGMSGQSAAFTCASGAKPKVKTFGIFGGRGATALPGWGAISSRTSARACGWSAQTMTVSLVWRMAAR